MSDFGIMNRARIMGAEWVTRNTERNILVLEGLYGFARSLRDAKKRGADPPSIEIIYEHLISMCESTGLRESYVAPRDEPYRVSVEVEGCELCGRPFLPDGKEAHFEGCSRLKSSTRSVAEFAMDLPKTHSLLTTDFTLCGLRNSFTFTTIPDTVDCPECLEILMERAERQKKYDHTD